MTRAGLLCLLLAGLALSAAAQGYAPDGRLSGYRGAWSGDPAVVDLDAYWDLDAGKIDLLRNEIFAARGRAFATPAYREYFAAQPWYRVDPAYSDARLSANDKANAEILAALTREPGGDLKAVLESSTGFAFGAGGNAASPDFAGVAFADGQATLAVSREAYHLQSKTVPYRVRGAWVRIDQTGFFREYTVYIRFNLGRKTTVSTILTVFH